MKGPTRTVKMKTTSGGEMTVRIPAGSMDKPTARGDRLFDSVTGAHWKDSTYKYRTDDKEVAEELAYTLNWYHGGHESEREGIGWVIWSEGYYAYGNS